MFTLFVPYLICICIYVIWQLNTLNGFSFPFLIYAISAIKIRIFLKRKKKYLFVKRLVLFSLVYLGLLFKKKKLFLSDYSINRWNLR